MVADRPRPDMATADVLIWQTGYRIVLALTAGVVAVGLRTAGFLRLSPVADAVIGLDAADWMLGLVTVLYALLVIGLRQAIQRTRSAGRALSTLMVAADLIVVFWLVFLLAGHDEYHLGLFVAFFSLQLTHVYFGRGPALLMLGASVVAYLLLNDIAARHGAPVSWRDVLVTLALFGSGAFLVTRIQSNLHERLGTLVAIFARAEEGDFSHSYDVAADRRPDAITSVGRAYNRMRTQLATIVLTDPLSGCFNRRGFEQQLKRELARAPARKPMSRCSPSISTTSRRSTIRTGISSAIRSSPRRVSCCAPVRAPTMWWPAPGARNSRFSRRTPPSTAPRISPCASWKRSAAGPSANRRLA